MLRRRFVLTLAAGLAVALAAADDAAAEAMPGPAGPEEGPLRKQRWLLPSPEWKAWMRATLFRPPGRGPFPLAVVNHGSSGDPQERAQFDTPTFQHVATWLVRRGFVVLVPQRVGHGETPGAYREELGSCQFADYRESAFGAAASIEAAILFIMGYPFVRHSRVLLVGHSAGALGCLALAVQRPRLPRAVIGFAAGHGGRYYGAAHRNCAPDRLVATVEEFGGTIRVPSLWLYAQNDTYFGPDLARRMADGYRSAGGQAEFHLLPPVGEDGHFLVHAPNAVALWAPIVEKFLARLAD